MGACSSNALRRSPVQPPIRVVGVRITLAHSRGTDLALAWRNVVRQGRRSAIGLVSVAAGVAARILAAGFIDWVYWAMREDTIGSRLGHIQIVRDGYFDAGWATPDAYLLPEKSATRERIAGIPGVNAVAQRLAVSGLASVRDTTVSFIGEGIEPAIEQPFERAVVITRGSHLSASDPRGVIVGQGLAQNLGLKVGATVVLVANTQSGGINAREVKVVGIFSTITKAYDDFASACRSRPRRACSRPKVSTPGWCCSARLRPTR